MGRINIGKMKYLFNQILYKGLKFIPTKYKKPLFLLSSILGLLTFFKVVLMFTQSKYLYMVPDILNQIRKLFEDVDQKLIVILLFLFFVILFKRYIIPPSEDSKKPNKSLYHEINSIISILYLAIIIFGILPLLGF